MASLYDNLMAGFQDPMMGLAAGLLTASQTPGGTFGGGLAGGMNLMQQMQAQQFRQDFATQELAQRVAEQRERRLLADRNYREQVRQFETRMAQPSDFERRLALANIDPTTPQGQAAVRDILMKPQFVMGESSAYKPMTQEEVLAVGGREGQGGYIDAKGQPHLTPAPSGEFMRQEALVGALKGELENINELYMPDGKVNRDVIGSGLPGTPSRTASQAMRRAIQNRLYLQSGQAAPAAEIESMMDMYSPKIWDSDEQIEAKLNAFNDFIGEFEPEGAEQATPQALDRDSIYKQYGLEY